MVAVVEATILPFPSRPTQKAIRKNAGSFGLFEACATYLQLGSFLALQIGLLVLFFMR